MYQSEKNFLEKLADSIPLLKGYRDKEARRDTDKRLREYLADRIDKLRNNIDEVKRAQLAAGQLEQLDDLDRLSSKLFKSANSIRHASYGYSGFFDQVKIEENELDRIYQYDLSLITTIDDLETRLKEDPTKTLSENRLEWESQISGLERSLENRKNLFVLTK